MSTRSRFLVAALLLAWLAYTVLLGALYALLPPNPDQAIFDYVGWVITQGGALYTDVAEQNFPGKMWMHAMSTWLFGNHEWSYRAFDYLLLLPTCWLMSLIARRVLGSVQTWIVVPLYQAMYVTAGAWAAGTRDMVAAHMLLAGGFAYYLRTTGRSAAWLVVYGIFCAAAVLTRPTYALFPPLVAIVEVAAVWRGRRKWRDVLGTTFVGSGVLMALLAGVALMGWRTGQLQEWYRLAISYNLGVYSHSASFAEVSYTLWQFVFSWHWYLAYAAAGCWIWWRSKEQRGLWAMTMTTAATAVLSAYAQRKGFGYHFVGFLPAIGIFASYFLSWTIRQAKETSGRDRWLLAVGAVGLAVIGLAKKADGLLGPQVAWLMGSASKHEMMVAHGYADAFEVAELVTRTVAPEGRVLVWSRMLHINFLAQRRSPTRFITVWMLDGLPKEFELGTAWVMEFEQDFRHYMPEAIVLDTPNSSSKGILSRDDPSEVIRFVQGEIHDHYRLEAIVGSLEVYRRI